MAKADVVDNLISSAMHESNTQEPSAAVRASLLARAAHATSSVAGRSIPPLVDELRDDAHNADLSWWEIERCQNENYSGWNHPRQFAIWLDAFRDVKRCRVGAVC